MASTWALWKGRPWRVDGWHRRRIWTAEWRESPDGFLDDIVEGKEIPDGVVDGNHAPGDPFHSHGREKIPRNSIKAFWIWTIYRGEENKEGQEPTMWCIGAKCRPIGDLKMWILIDDYNCRIRTVCLLWRTRLRTGQQMGNTCNLFYRTEFPSVLLQCIAMAEVISISIHWILDRSRHHVAWGNM